MAESYNKKNSCRETENLRFELWTTVLALTVSIVCSVFLIQQLSVFSGPDGWRLPWSFVAARLVFAGAILFLVYGNLVYLLTRLGALYRMRRYLQSGLKMEPDLDGVAPPVVILVPSYKEEERVVRRTLLSAALQDYPNRRVVLLIDDPPHPTSAAEAEQLATMRALPALIEGELSAIASDFAEEAVAFERRASDAIDRDSELTHLVELYSRAADWLQTHADQYPVHDHEDRFFVDEIILCTARRWRAEAAELVATKRRIAANVDEQLFRRHYKRLAGLFKVDLSSFERKRYENLSHEPNKAMNLNAYLGMMGVQCHEQQRKDGLYLLPFSNTEAPAEIEEAEFVVTLDADSVILGDYVSRLMSLMQTPGNEQVAVVQTPYSAFPNAPTVLEHVAGATTDIQYQVHQGFTLANATFWVGANALLRKAALEDIKTTSRERGHPVTKYIQDRTVIEDTESSVDLVRRGWSLYNHPERLAYSATPPDFGSLIIQRRRWANGGLLIWPKLMSYLLTARRGPHRLLHGVLGSHYLTSPAGVNAGVLMLLFFPVEDMISNPWLPAVAFPYFVLYGRDLRRMGYRFSDMLRVYALNMLLIPVNLSGVLRSIFQGLTGHRSAFGRTPKIHGRTVAAPTILLPVFGLLLGITAMAVTDAFYGRWLHGLFAAVNASFLAYGLLRFIGLRESVADLILPVQNFIGRWLAALSATNDTLPVDCHARPVAIREENQA